MHLSETEIFLVILQPTAYNMEKALETLEDTTDVNWTYIPSKFFDQGTESGIS